MKVLVVGHRGFIGPLVVKHLKHAGAQVHGIDESWYDESIRTWKNLDLMQLTGAVVAEFNALAPSEQPREILVDSIGQPIRVECVNVVELPSPDFVVGGSRINVRVVAERLPAYIGPLAVLEREGVGVNASVFVLKVYRDGVEPLAGSEGEGYDIACALCRSA